MKTFKDLQFKPHSVDKKCLHAVIEFENGYGCSVVFGDRFYSNGIDTYEVAVLYAGAISYNSGITDDVIGYVNDEQVTEIMKQIQELH